MSVQITVMQLHVLRTEAMETRGEAEISDFSSKWLLFNKFLSELPIQHWASFAGAANYAALTEHSKS